MHVLFILLITASSLFAQPWLWQQYQGTFWHQTNEDIPWIQADWMYPSQHVAGDFNGNGRDEILLIRHGNYLHTETSTEGQVAQWEEQSRDQSWFAGDVVFLFAQAIDLDDDPNDELFIYTATEDHPEDVSVRCFDPDDQDVPAFTERPDYVGDFAYPEFPDLTLFGDLDGNGMLDGLTIDGENLIRSELSDDTSWSYVETLSFNLFMLPTVYFAADINSDGDTEFGFYEPGIDCNCLIGDVLDFHDGGIYNNPGTGTTFLSPGDYDGDGTNESFVQEFDLSLPSSLVRLNESELFSYTELANQWEANSPAVFSSTASGENRLFGFYNGVRFEMGTWRMVPAGYAMEWSDSSWDLTGNGMYYGNVYEGNTANIDEDNSKEYIYRMLVADWFGPNIEIWSIGYGNLERFYDNQDTVFTHPRIGNVLDDRAGELVTYVTSGAPAGLYFYELELENFHVIAHHQPYLSEGLPTNMTEFTLADIDNDGQTELFIHTGFWRSFFWRNGHWEEYANILPPGVGLNLYFADFEGDGDLDIFAQNGVWISLTPTAVEEPLPQPESFKLSSYPNPFNAQTTITFDLTRAGDVTLKLFDVLGRDVETIMDKPLSAGVHTVHYDAASMPSGVYFAELTFGATKLTHKLLLLK